LGTWNNSDGLRIDFGLDEGKKGLVGKASTMGARQQVVCVIEASRLTLAGGLIDPRSRTALPAGSRISSATLVVTETFTGSSSTLDLGLANADGTYTNLDEDGIDAGIALSALDVGDVVVCDGALVGATAAARTSVIGYPSMDADTAVFTAGKAYLIIEFDVMPYGDQDA
jgi:hypothetical protein